KKAKKIGDDEEYMKFSSELGKLYGDQGNYAKALQYFQDVMNKCKKSFGEHHLKAAETYNNVGTTLNNLGKHEEALKFLQQALEIRKKSLGEQHIETVKSYSNVGLN